MKSPTVFLSILVLLLIIGCTPSTAPAGSPKWIKDLIATYEKEPVGNPPQSIWHYEYNGQTVYYVPPQCCDQFSKLYTENGEVLCAPDGGFTGRGDVKCSDFFQARENGRLIWQDARTP
jgi:YHS domain-containing protein